MKRTYNKPKALYVDFNYEEKVTASSTGYIGNYGGAYFELCQHGSAACYKYWQTETTMCRESPSDWSLRP